MARLQRPAVLKLAKGLNEVECLKKKKKNHYTIRLGKPKNCRERLGYYKPFSTFPVIEQQSKRNCFQQ